MAAFTGSEKQVAWAKDIYAKKYPRLEACFDRQFARIDELLSKLREDDRRRENVLLRKQVLEGVRAWMNGTTPARFWIDFRDTPSPDVITAAAAKIGGEAHERLVYDLWDKVIDDVAEAEAVKVIS